MAPRGASLRRCEESPVTKELFDSGHARNHHRRAIVESALNLYYLDETFPDPPLMPREPLLRHRVRLYNKLVDE